MLPDEVRKAVERFGSLMKFAGSENGSDWQTIRAHLLAREAEADAVSTELRTMRGEFAKQFKRAERADALLREALPYCDTFPDLLRDGGDELRDRITAHLSENSRDA